MILRGRVILIVHLKKIRNYSANIKVASATRLLTEEYPGIVHSVKNKDLGFLFT
jgi:hypothetical protein